MKRFSKVDTINNSIGDRQTKVKGVFNDMFYKVTKSVRWIIVAVMMSGLFLSFAFSVSAKENDSSSTRNSPDPNLTFDVISDTQHFAGNITSKKKIKAALEDLHEANPDTDAMVVNGDIVNDGMKLSYNEFADIFNSSPHPDTVFFNIGNHEYFSSFATDSGMERAKEKFKTFNNEAASTEIDEVYYKREVEGFPFIFLGSEGWGPVGKHIKDSAKLSDEQLEWFKDSLDEYEEEDPDRPIFVFLHQPMQNTLLNTDNDNLKHYKDSILDMDNENIENKMKEIFKEHPQVIFFTAHMHYDLGLPKMFVQEDNITYANSGAVWNSWEPDGSDGETSNPSPSSGLHVKVYDDRVDINGRDFKNKEWIDEYQHTISSPKNPVGELKLENERFIKGKSSEIKGEFTNKSDKPEENVELTLNAMDDLSIESTSKTTFDEVQPEETVQATWSATPNNTDSHPFDGRANFQLDGQDTSVTTSKSKTIADSKSVTDLKSNIDQLQKGNEIKKDKAAHELNIHLNAVEHFTKQKKAKKVVKHMKSFKSLVDHQKKEDAISDKASKTLHKEADSIINEWQE